MKSQHSINSVDISSYYQLSDRKLFKQARQLYRKNRIHDAIAILASLQRKSYEPVPVQFLLAQCYDRLSFLLKDIEFEDLAKSTYEKLLSWEMKRRMRKRIQREYDRLVNRICELGEGDYRAFMKAHQLKRNDIKTPKAWLVLGSNFNIRKDVDFVISAYKNALALDPHYICALYKLGYVYQHNKMDPASAMPFYVRAVKCDPDEDRNESTTTNARCILDACNQLGRLYYEHSEHRKVIAVFNHAIKTQNDHLPSSVLTSIRELIYLADLSSIQINIKDKLDAHLKAQFEISLTMMVQQYCKNISVA